jgi:hypothetical protein
MDKLLNFKTLETKDVLELFEIHKQTIKKINRLSRKIKENYCFNFIIDKCG